MHSCSHAGRPVVYGEPCARATSTLPSSSAIVDSSAASFSSVGSSSGSDTSSFSQFPSCNFTTDYGAHNVPALCARCVDGGAMTVRDMLSVLKGCRRVAEETAGKIRSSETCTVSVEANACMITDSADAPDLGSLEFLGTDWVGREVVERTRMHWRECAGWRREGNR
jgi:hypothetical protein